MRQKNQGKKIQQGGKNDDESDAIQQLVKESEVPEPDETLWDATTLGKATINEPTKTKKLAESQDGKMEPVSEKIFQEIADDLDPVDLKLKEKCEKIIDELEGIF